MKRKALIAVITGTLMVGGGAATAVAVAGGDGGKDEDRIVRESSVQLTHHDRDDADDRNERDDRDVSGRDDRDDRDDDRLPAGVKVSAADAIAKALAERSGTAVSADLDDEDGKVAWDIEVIDGKRDVYTVIVDPGTGKVLGVHRDADDDDDFDDVKAELAAAKGASVDAVGAAKAAAAKGAVTSLDLDTDRSGATWDVETVNGAQERDWNVSLDTAKVTPDRDDDNRDDNRDDDSDDTDDDSDD
ncbi:PepSY domain-containing protein [Streptomyces sp. NPDC002490]|uniref:PepSY domain-containing protein n=1 Tax=Streptomyces sp. NPDC002490 TaxID=3154416 RepID=UPI003330EAE4